MVRLSARAAALLLLLTTVAACQTPASTPPATAPDAEEGAGRAVSPQPGQQSAFVESLFAEPTLDAVVAYGGNGEAAERSPWRQFRAARDALEAGDKERAVAILRDLAEGRKSSLSTRLWAWANLRRLGVEPPAALADKVEGVVYEVPVNGGVEYLAAYADGRWRHLYARGGGQFWEHTDDRETKKVTDAVLARGREALSWTADPAPRDTARPEALRVTLITYGGLRQITLDPAQMAPDSALRPVAEGLADSFTRLYDHAESLAGRQA